MGSFLVHLIACNPKFLENPCFRIGLESPNLIQEYVNRYGIDKSYLYWEKLWIPGIPHFERFRERATQVSPKNSHGHDGLHFGSNLEPDINFFWTCLTAEEKKLPFWAGYRWHLVQDSIIHKRLNIEILMSVQCSTAKEPKLTLKKELKTLEADWYKVNSWMLSLYPNIQIPSEIEELNVIRFEHSGDPKYISKFMLLYTIEQLRNFNPLEIKSSDIELLLDI